MFEALPRKQGEPAADYALRVLHYNIMTVRLEPGQSLKENELTEKLGISRTPLREALISLSAMHLVGIVPQSGTRVALIDPALINEGIFLRQQVEPAITERACSIINEAELAELDTMLAMQKKLLESNKLEQFVLWDNAFHEKFYLICGAEKTFRAVSGLCGHYDMVRALGFYCQTTKEVMRDHKKIFKAMKERDGAAAREISTQHIIRKSKEHLLAITRHFPHYFIR
jgi:DNA-binding GntR family transcriptional regulator